MRRFLHRIRSKAASKSKLFLFRKFLVVVFHLAGFVYSIDAIMSTRTPHGAIAWAVSLNAIPYVAVPAYWVFGEVDFEDYIEERKVSNERIQPIMASLRQSISEKNLEADGFYGSPELIEELFPFPPTKGNTAELLVDGPDAFASIFEGIAKAEDYVLVQFYTIEDGKLGEQLADILIERARAGVDCYVLYDDIGTDVSDDYLGRLREAGVETQTFNVFPQPMHLSRLNLRNHRKLIVVDGKAAWLGGMNIKESYLEWRDNMVRLEGPVVPCMQMTFLEDWAWANGDILRDLDWELRVASDGPGVEVASLPSGPAEALEIYALFATNLILQAKERIWIASPYFVPDEAFVRALQDAALRGVDVRVLIPEEVDTTAARLAQYAAWSYVEDLEAAGARLYQFETPFMHQKIMLADDRFCAIGSANFDNRSFRLNFELTAAITDEAFAGEVSDMLEKDFAKASEITQVQIDGHGFWKRLQIRLSRLAAPVL